MTEEERVKSLEELAARLRESREQRDAWSSPGGIGDRVSGIQVTGPDGAIKQEWHDED